MTATAKAYGRLTLSLFAGEVSTAHPLKVTLHTSAYTPNQDTHRYYADLAGELPTANGYTAGGFTLANVATAYDAPTNTLTLTASNPTWNGTVTARYAVVRDATTGALLGFLDFGADTSSIGGAFTIEWNAAGVLTLPVAA